MKVKAKKCNGIGKARGFVGCGNEVLKRTYGLCQSCLKNWMLNTDEGQLYLDRVMIKGAKKHQKELSKRRRVALESKINYRDKLQRKINEIVRLIDIGQPCLARGIHPKQMHAGHVYSVGSNNTIRFNLHNIHRQSAQSNHFGNEDGLLREGLLLEYGNEYAEFVKNLRRTPQIKYNNAEYKDFYKVACQIANDLKKAGKVYHSPSQRILARNHFNQMLGIYPEKFMTYGAP